MKSKKMSKAAAKNAVSKMEKKGQPKPVNGREPKRGMKKGKK